MAATLVAIATAPASGGIGVLRVSGAAALEAALGLAPDVPAVPTPRHAHFTRFVDRQGGALDQGLFLYFPAPRSFTGEDVVELQVHGSPRLLVLLQSELLRDARVQLAGPGDFSRRAFLNGRLDLTRAEAVADLVAADSEAAVRAAAAQVQGALSARIRALREPLVNLHADLEAALNFPEELEGEDPPAVRERLRNAAEGVRALHQQAGQGRLLRRGARVVLFGPVNAGKSTLFNALLQEARALVDEEPGTTRDVLEARLELQGLGLTLVDTAGLRPTPGRLEALGIELARNALRGADLALLILPPATPESDAATWAAEAGDVPVLRVLSKVDLSEGCEPGAQKVEPPPLRPLRVSGRTGAGVEALREQVLLQLTSRGRAEAIAVTSDRHADALGRSLEALQRAAEALEVSTLEVVAGEVGIAVEALGEITGESASADLLDAIFRRFCIGK